MIPACIIHGGCDSADLNEPIERDRKEAQRAGLASASREAWKLVRAGERALDIVERVINLLEDDPTFNAGIGGALGVGKRVELDASIMNGKDGSCGAVSCLHGVPHAISVARAVMEKTPHVFLAGEGANSFAREVGFQTLPNEAFITPYQEHWYNLISQENAAHRVGKGTVGAVVLDTYGDLASGTSTGGLTLKRPGRVGDSPLIGCGNYSENGVGGASATGWGEQIVKSTLCHAAIEIARFTGSTAQQACEQAIARLGKLKNGLGGIIMIDGQGRVGAFANERFLPRAFASGAMNEPKVRLEVGA